MAENVAGVAAAGGKSSQVPDKDEQKVQRVKVTYTLPPNIVTELELSQARLRRLLPPRQRGAVNRGVIVETALRLALADLEDNGPESRVYRNLLDAIT